MASISLNISLYEEVRELIKADAVEYPSIKNFVEKAVKREIARIRVAPRKMDPFPAELQALAEIGKKNPTIYDYLDPIFEDWDDWK